MVSPEHRDEPHPASSRRARRRTGAVLSTIETTVEQADGRAVLVKRSGDPAGRAAIAHEARMLGLARHPGVAEVREVEDDGDHTRLVLTFISSHPLASTPCHSPAHAAGVVAAIAETVADLHHLGVIHGRISAEHIVLDPQGHPILVGFRQAQAAAFGAPTADRPSPAFDDVEGPVGQHRHDDVAALGRLLRDLVLVHPDTSPVIPEHRWRRSRSDAQDRRALLTLADHATADTPSARPGARRFAAAILTAVPTASLVRPTAAGPDLPGASAASPRLRAAENTGPVGPTPTGDPGGLGGPGTGFGGAGSRDTTDPLHDSHGPHGSHGAGASDAAAAEAFLRPHCAIPTRPSRRHAAGSTRPRRGLPWAAGLLGVTLLAFGTASFQHGARPSIQSAEANGADSSTRPDSPSVPALGPHPDGTGVANDAPSASDVPPLRYQSAGIVDHDGHRYTIGTLGDELAIGALGCSPSERDRVAVLRVATGELFVFDGWAAPDAPRQAPVVSRVAAGSKWSVRTDRCAPLRLIEPDGNPVTVAIPPEASP